MIPFKKATEIKRVFLNVVQGHKKKKNVNNNLKTKHM